MRVSDVTDVDGLLENSVKQYSKILLHSDRLVGMLDTLDYSDIRQHALDLDELQNKACLNDQRLLTQIEKDPATWKNNVLFLKRQETIRTILERNRTLLPRLKSILAVARAERDSFLVSRAAVTGYTSLNDQKKKLSRTA